MRTTLKNGFETGKTSDPLVKKVQVFMAPEIHRALRIATLRDGFPTMGHWLHHQLCRMFGREDLQVEHPEKVETAS